MTTFNIGGSAVEFTTSGTAATFSVVPTSVTFSVTGGAGPAGATTLDALTDVDTTGVTDDDVLTYSGGTWVAAAGGGTASGIPESTIDAKGDLLVGSANDAVDNLTVGANDTVLMAASGQTLGVAWTALSTSHVSGAVATSRTISTTSPLSGGGDLSANRTLTIADGSTAAKGAVQLTDSTSSTSTTTAATPNSVKSAYDLANGAVPKSLADAKGDLFVATADNTVARLAVGGTAGHVLTVDSGETTGLKWAAVSGSGIAESLLDAKGDLIVASAADTAARLAVGTNGHVLTADSGEATGVKWAAASGGGLVLLDDGAPSAASSFTITGFDSAYDDFRLIMRLLGSTDIILKAQLKVSGTPSTSGYTCNRAFFSGSDDGNDTNQQGTDEWMWQVIGAGAPSLFGLDLGSVAMAEATTFHGTQACYYAQPYVSMIAGVHSAATAYDSITVTANTGTITGRWRLYGYAK